MKGIHPGMLKPLTYCRGPLKVSPNMEMKTRADKNKHNDQIAMRRDRDAMETEINGHEI